MNLIKRFLLFCIVVLLNIVLSPLIIWQWLKKLKKDLNSVGPSMDFRKLEADIRERNKKAILKALYPSDPDYPRGGYEG